MPKRLQALGRKILLFGHVVHVDRDAQHRGQRDQVGADVAVAERAVVGAPVVHHRVDVAERALRRSVAARTRWSARWGWCARSRTSWTLARQLDRPALGDLQHRAQALDQVQADMVTGMPPRGDEVRGEAAAAEVLGDGRVPGGGLEALRRPRPSVISQKGFIAGWPSRRLPAGAVQRRGAGVDQVDQAARGRAGQRRGR